VIRSGESLQSKNPPGIAGNGFSATLPTPFGAQGKGQVRRVNARDIGGLGSIDTSKAFDESDDGHDENEAKGRKRAVEAGVDS
jgi:hypothetical protein